MYKDGIDKCHWWQEDIQCQLSLENASYKIINSCFEEIHVKCDCYKINNWREWVAFES